MKSDEYKYQLTTLRELLRYMRKYNFRKPLTQRQAKNNTQLKALPKYLVDKMTHLAERGGIKKSFEAADRFINPSPPIAPEIIVDCLPDLYPQTAPEVQVDLPESAPIKLFHFENDDIRAVISSQNSLTSAGPSGLSNEYLKELSKTESFITLLKCCFEQLIANPDMIDEIPELFQFDALFLEKPKKHANDKTSLRPIAMQEAVLNVFHLLVLKEIKQDLSKG